ncbi:PAS domain-containing sensor histidine kinase [Novosphingobium sp. KACC 22771]|uniref:PAS domain-containing sensor histidine kinase n=1 Tax=Novosphingobium sp. KACC 22771 TaxID=3025670 RepID=UPI0023664867|nr:ATP-binding protein [Novosphingobium sp. KACC 22771]WDF72556.1 ATP-binding protein [Novosphingobium sp. KACC 22771]
MLYPAANKWDFEVGGESSSPLLGSLGNAHVFAGLLAAIIFLLDAFTRADLAVAGLYVLVLLIGTSVEAPARRRAIIGWSSACALLSLAGYAIFRSRGAPPLALVHLAFSLTVLWVTTLVLLRMQAMNASVQSAERRYRLLFDSLAVSIWEHDFSEVAAALEALRARGITDIRRYLGDHPQFVAAMRRRVRITDVNARALTMMGVQCKAEFFKSLSDFLAEGDDSFTECLVAVWERRKHFQSEATVIPTNGVPKEVIVAFSLGPEASLDRVPGSILDVSQSKALEEQILRTREELADVQRTGALAAMSATIAHELNQPMTVIHCFADAARRWLGRTPPNMEETERALAGLSAGVEHARQVMLRVRALVGDARVDQSEVELESVLTTSVALMGREASETSTRLSICPQEDNLIVLGDRILLKQVFVNLITNALQAMLAVPPAERAVYLASERRGDKAVITVSDRGPGWAQVGARRAFDTFYTTKKNGMGLGLYISRAVVERHGGSMSLREGDCGGAVIEIILPLAPERDGSSPAGDRLFDGGEQSFAV